MEEYRSGYRILIAESDESVQNELSEYFKREGFQVFSARDGEAALEAVRKLRPNIVTLDVLMPKMDGLTLCREIRRESNVPILIISAKNDEFDRLLGLEMGADDYIAKPYSPREVVARAKVVLRRVHEMKDTEKKMYLSVDNLEIDMGSFIVKLGGETVPCTPKEIEILWTLAGNPGMVFSREHLLQSIWGYDFLGDTRAVDSHIKRIRAKLCKPGNGWDIKTVWGVGYRLETQH